jgi:hypothetical protein
MTVFALHEDWYGWTTTLLVSAAAAAAAAAAAVMIAIVAIQTANVGRRIATSRSSGCGGCC